MRESKLSPVIEIEEAAGDLRAALARERRLRRDLVAESGVSAPVVTAFLNGHDAARRMGLHNLGLIAAALGYGVRVSVFPLSERERGKAA